MLDLVGPAGDLHVVVTGDGEPSTVFVPGLAQSIADTRAFGSAVAGRRGFVDLRGHGGSAAPPDATGWTYQGLADDVSCAADMLDATRALGVSLGAGAIARLLAARPDRFERVVLALPGPLTEARTREALDVTDELARAIGQGSSVDPAAVSSALVRLQPEAVRSRTDVKLWARRHAAELARWPGIAEAIRELPRQTALPSLDVLAGVSGEVLVLAQRDDDVHPLSSAEALVDVLPHAELVVSDSPWIWRARSELRHAVSGFLNG